MLRRIRRPSAQHVGFSVHVQLRHRWRVHRVSDWLEHGARVPHRDVSVRMRAQRQSRLARQRRDQHVRPELRGIPRWVRYSANLREEFGKKKNNKTDSKSRRQKTTRKR